MGYITDNAIEFEKGQIILFEGDKQYSIRETENGYVASDATGLEFTQGELLGGGYVYDEFVYDEELGAYVLDLVAEMGMYWEVRFEDGIPVSVIYNEFEEKYQRKLKKMELILAQLIKNLQKSSL